MKSLHVLYESKGDYFGIGSVGIMALLSYAFNASLFTRKYGNEFDVIVEEFSPAIPTFLHAFTSKPLVLGTE